MGSAPSAIVSVAVGTSSASSIRNTSRRARSSGKSISSRPSVWHPAHEGTVVGIEGLLIRHRAHPVIGGPPVAIFDEFVEDVRCAIDAGGARVGDRDQCRWLAPLCRSSDTVVQNVRIDDDRNRVGCATVTNTSRAKIPPNRDRRSARRARLRWCCLSAARGSYSGVTERRTRVA